MKRNNQLNMFILGCLFMLSLGWTYTWDTTTPAGTDAPSVIDNRIREVKQVVQEMLNIDHYFPLTGTQVSDADAGKHRQINFRANITTPTQIADETNIYQKAGELYWQDGSNTEIALTSAGKLSGAAFGSLPNNTYLKAVDAAGTGTINLIKGDANDVAVVPDGTQTATNAAPAMTKGVANKKYVDDQIDATVGSGTANPLAYVGGESVTLPNGLIIKMGYKVTTATSGTLTFGAAFPSGIVSVMLVDRGTVGHFESLLVSAQTVTGFSWITYAMTDKTGFNWIAIGY